MTSYLLICLIGVVFIAFWAGRTKAVKLAGSELAALHSRPDYHGLYTVILTAFPALLLIPVWNFFASRIIEGALKREFADHVNGLGLPQLQAFLRDVNAIVDGGIASNRDEVHVLAAQYLSKLNGTSDWLLTSFVLLLMAAGFFHAYRQISVQNRSRHVVEKTIRWIVLVCSVVAIFTTIGIVLSLIFESVRFFGKVPLLDFLFGLHWSPQSAFEGAGAEALADDNSKIFGAIPLFLGTFLVTIIAMAVAGPIGLMAAIYLSDYASSRFRAIAKPLLEILAGIPTVVYGFFAALTVAPAIRGWGESFGLSVSSESALAAGLVMGIMIIPFVSSLSDDVINAVPQSLRDGSAGLGATKSETIRKVVLPAALPGIVAAMMLAISRAIGETMIVFMAAGTAANLTINPLEAVTTVTVQIVTLLVGDQEFDSAKTLAAFALGLVLFFITLVLNIIALRVVQKYREQYD